MPQTPSEPTEVHVIRCYALNQSGDKIWVLVDKTRKMVGAKSTGKKALIKRWQRLNGPISKLISYEGRAMRTSEAVCTIVDIQEKNGTKQEST